MKPEIKFVWQDEIQYDGVVKMHVIGAPFWQKGVPTTATLQAVDIVKKTVVEFLKIQSIFTALFFTSKKQINKILKSFIRIGYGVMEPYLYYKIFSPDTKLNLMPVSRGVGKITDLFLIYYGIGTDVSHKVAELVAHIVEYDGAYRYRILDIVNIADYQKLLENPRKEIQRVMKIWYTRDQMVGNYITLKLDKLKWAVWILEIPKVKKAFQNSLKLATLDLFKIDESDYYWMSQRKDYLYFGKTFDDRMIEFKEKGWTLPMEYTEEEWKKTNGTT